MTNMKITWNNIYQIFIWLLLLFCLLAYFYCMFVDTAHAESDTESETDSSEQQEQELEQLDTTPSALSDFHQCMAEKKYVGFNASVAKSLDDKVLSADLYMEWTGEGETDTVQLSTFVTKQLGDASSKQQADINLEKILDTNNRITKQLLDRNFLDHKHEYVSEMDEAKLIPMPSREPHTTFSKLSSIESKYSEEESKILQHHIKAEKLILDTSKPLLDSFDESHDEKK